MKSPIMEKQTEKQVEHDIGFGGLHRDDKRV